MSSISLIIEALKVLNFVNSTFLGIIIAINCAFIGLGILFFTFSISGLWPKISPEKHLQRIINQRKRRNLERIGYKVKRYISKELKFSIYSFSVILFLMIVKKLFILSNLLLFISLALTILSLFYSLKAINLFEKISYAGPYAYEEIEEYYGEDKLSEFAKFK